MTFEGRITETLRAPVAPDLRAALDRRVRAAIDAAPAPPRRGFNVTRALVLVGLLALALPGVIVGGVRLTEGFLGLIDARAFAEEIEAAKDMVPLPAGRAWPEYFRAGDPNAMFDRGGALPWAESIATCLWLDEWLDARAAADIAREGIAAQAIAGIPSWQSWNTPFFDQSYRDYYRSIFGAVARGDERPVRANVPLNCPGTP
jgi:hypothetical protein